MTSAHWLFMCSFRLVIAIAVSQQLKDAFEEVVL